MVKLTEQEVKAFVGPKAGYYLQAWLPALDGESRAVGLNWAALLLSGLWLPYRKMYRPTVLFLGAILIESILEDVVFLGILGRPEAPTAVSRIVGLVAAVLCGTLGNHWYLSHARKVIAEVRSQGLPEEEYLRVLAERGGTSLLASLGFFLLFLVAAFATALVWSLLFPKA